MLGFRGCRLGIAYPEITEMQVCASILCVWFVSVCVSVFACVRVCLLVMGTQAALQHALGLFTACNSFTQQHHRHIQTQHTHTHTHTHTHAHTHTHTPGARHL
jgi:hypothetical protein